MYLYRQHKKNNITGNLRFPAGWGGSLTCVHLIHAVEEVVWRAGDAVTAHAQAAVRALVPGVVGPAVRETWRTPFTVEPFSRWDLCAACMDVAFVLLSLPKDECARLSLFHLTFLQY